MSVEVIEVDGMLLGWSETHNGGEKVTFQLQPGQIEHFKAKTIKRGKVAGQMFKMVLVEVDGNGEPVAPGPETSQPSAAPAKRAGGFPGGLCGLAVRWCEEREFAEWLEFMFPGVSAEAPISRADNHKEFSAWVVKHICQIESRRVLNQPGRGQQIFDEQIRVPFAAFRKEVGLE